MSGRDMCWEKCPDPAWCRSKLVWLFQVATYSSQLDRYLLDDRVIVSGRAAASVIMD